MGGGFRLLPLSEDEDGEGAAGDTPFVYEEPDDVFSFRCAEGVVAVRGEAVC